MTAKARTRTITLTPFRNNIAPMTITVALPSYNHDIEQFQRTFSAHVIAVLNARPAEVFDRRQRIADVEPAVRAERITGVRDAVLISFSYVLSSD